MTRHQRPLAVTNRDQSRETRIPLYERALDRRHEREADAGKGGESVEVLPLRFMPHKEPPLVPEPCESAHTAQTAPAPRAADARHGEDGIECAAVVGTRATGAVA